MFTNIWSAIIGIFKRKPAVQPAPTPVTPIAPSPVPAVVVTPPAPAPATPPPKAWAPTSFAVKSPRKLQLELELLMDKKLMSINPGGLKAAIDNKDGNELVALANESLLAMGVREATNNNDGKMVNLIQKTVGLPSGIAWCMAQQQTCIAYAEKKLGVVSTIVADGSTITVAHDTPSSHSVMTPAQQKAGQAASLIKGLKRGDIWIWQHGSEWLGHTGCFMKWATPYSEAHLIEGNTTNGAVGGVIVREGGGTYYTSRSTGQIGNMTLISVVRAF